MGPKSLKTGIYEVFILWLVNHQVALIIEVMVLEQSIESRLYAFNTDCCALATTNTDSRDTTL